MNPIFKAAIAKVDSPTLFSVLRANGIFSGISALLILVLAEKLGAWLGVGAPFVFYIIAVGLAAFSARLLWIARSETILKIEAWSIIAGDISWVVLSIALLWYFPAVTGVGEILILSIAAVVTSFAWFQFSNLPTQNRAVAATER